MGRLRIWASPSTTTVPSTAATAAVRKRVAVPALPRWSGPAGSRRMPSPATTNSVAPGSSTRTPMARSASAISRVSSLFSAPVSRLVPRARPASRSARLVMLFDPGGDTRPRSASAGGTTVTAGIVRSKLIGRSPDRVDAS